VKFLWVFLGGGLGSLARFYISLFASKFSYTFPYPTLISNITASIILGVVAAFIFGQSGNMLRYLVIIGFCGGFSTFSSFSFETFELLRDGQLGLAVLNVLLSTLLCLVAIYLGFSFGKNL